jgi:cation:H+ antiporter
MTLHLTLIAIGTFCLYFGAVYLVKGASAMARLAGMSTFAIAATVVALGTSSPELLVTFFAAIRGSSEVALGNILGSNIANIALVLATSCLFVNLVSPRSVLKRDYPVMLSLTVLLYILSFNGVISRLDGFLLTVTAGWYLFHILTHQDERVLDSADEVEVYAVTKSLTLTIIGLAVVLLGAKLMVDSGVAVARQMGVRELVIGMTLVAVGSSLPELATSVVAAFRGESDITVGNVVGSNIMNVGMVLGLVAMIRPIEVPAGTTSYEFPVLIIISAIPMVLLKRYGTVPRWAAAALLIAYGVFIFTLPVVRGVGG